MSGAFYDGQVPVEFLTEWRDNEYIRKHMKGMAPEEARRFALLYYGWGDDEVSMLQGKLDQGLVTLDIEGEELSIPGLITPPVRTMETVIPI